MRTRAKRRAYAAGWALLLGLTAPLAAAERPVLEARLGARQVANFQASETLSFRVVMTAGTYLEVEAVAIRTSTVVQLAVFAPGEPPRCRHPFPALTGTEVHMVSGPRRLGWLAESAGEYTLQLQESPGTEPPEIALTVVAVREPTADDWLSHWAWQDVSRGLEWLGHGAQGHTPGALDSLSQAELAFRSATAAATALQQPRLLLRGLDGQAEVLYAREHFAAAELAWTEILRLAQQYQDAAMLLEGYHDRALSYDRLKEQEKAERDQRAHLVQAQVIGDLVEQWRGHRWMGQAALRRQQLEVAEAEFRRAAVIASQLPGASREPALALQDLANVLVELGRFNEARDTFLQALGTDRGRPQERVTFAKIRQDLGRVYDLLGEIDRAREEILQSLSSLEGVPNAYAQTLSNLGDVSVRLNDESRALDFYERARNVAGVDDIAVRSGVLSRLAILYARQERFQEALEAADLSLQEAQKARLPGGKGEALARGTFGEVLIRAAPGDPKTLRLAITYFDSALASHQQRRDRFSQPRVYEFRAQTHRLLGAHELALDDLRRALEINEGLSLTQDVAFDLHKMAEIEQERGQLDEALAYADRAHGKLQELRQRVRSLEARALYQGTKPREVQELRIDLLMAKHDQDPSRGWHALAFFESERARGQSLVDLLTQGGLKVSGAGVSPQLRDRRDDLRRQIQALTRRRDQLTEQDSASKTVFDLANQIQSLLSALEATEREIGALNPGYDALWRPDALTADQVRQELLDEDTVLLEYLLGEHSSYLWVLTRQGLESFRLPPRAVIENQARGFHGLLASWAKPPDGSLSAGRERIAREFDRSTRELGELLLGAPWRAGLLTGKRLVFVTDGALEYIPLAALAEPGQQPMVYLAERHVVSRLPSASVLALLRQPAPTAAPPSDVLAIFADPLYDSRDLGLDGRDRVRGSPGPEPLGRLSASAKEAQWISAHAPADKTRQFLREAANLDSVLSGDLRRYRVLHFATHGEINTEFPALSKLILSQFDSQGRPREGDLTLSHIYDLQLDADLVVLSACETALGRAVRGEGLLGLTRGFMYAGAQRVLASLWQVQDVATAELMSHFYRGLLEEGRPATSALQRAQVALLTGHDGAYRFPYYWAGFVLQGDWR